MPRIRRCSTDVILKQKKAKEQIRRGKVFSRGEMGKGMELVSVGSGVGDPGLSIPSQLGLD